MRRNNRLTALALAAALVLSLLTGCADEGEGLSFSVSVGEDVSNLDPIYAEDVQSQTVLVHLYENLMRVVKSSGSTGVANGCAKRVDVDENTDGTVTYTFRLRSAHWSDGQPVTADNFVYAWQRLAHPSSHSPFADLLSVVCGYEEARSSGDMTKLQVSAKNDSTLVVTLDGNYDWFLTEVCTSPATLPLREDVVQKLKEEGIQAAGEGGEPQPWWCDPAKLVTNGPYVAAPAEEKGLLKLTASPEYSETLTGPSQLTFCFANSEEEAWQLYEDKSVDAVWPLPEEQLEARAQDPDWKPIPELSTYSVVYNGDRLEDPTIRQALALVIDRSELTELAGVTAVAAEGLVPPGVPENEEGDFRTVGGPVLDNDPDDYADRCREARELISGAGYDSGAELGEFRYLYAEERNNAQVAEALCRQWRTQLGIQVEPQGVREQELWAALRSGEYTIAGVNVEATGNDAECFLMDWVTDGQNNVARYQNSAYDTLMSIIAIAANGVARMGCLHDAEALLLEDSVLTPLYTRGTDWAQRDGFTGAVRDPRGWFCFANVTVQTG